MSFDPFNTHKQPDRSLFAVNLLGTRSASLEGGRIVTQNAATNWYGSFRHSGIAGAESYFIIGDPNAPRFVRQGLMKMIFAI